MSYPRPVFFILHLRLVEETSTDSNFPRASVTPLSGTWSQAIRSHLIVPNRLEMLQIGAGSSWRCWKTRTWESMATKTQLKTKNIVCLKNMKLPTEDQVLSSIPFLGFCLQETLKLLQLFFQNPQPQFGDSTWTTCELKVHLSRGLVAHVAAEPPRGGGGLGKLRVRWVENL